MPIFGTQSSKQLDTIHPDLIRVLVAAIRVTDFTILCGHRNKEDQDNAYNAGASQVQYPDSQHNHIPSLAVDIAPYPIDWEDIARFQILSLVIFGIADSLGVNIVWGGHWTNFKDYPHYQLGVKS